MVAFDLPSFVAALFVAVAIVAVAFDPSSVVADDHSSCAWLDCLLGASFVAYLG